MTRGYLTIAENGPSGDYLRMAYALALSLKATQASVNNLSVAVTPGTDVPPYYREVFDQVIELPWEDHAVNELWKIHNKWKVFHITPYDETVLLDADMLFPLDVSGWWDFLARKDAWVCTNIKTYRGETPLRNPYRTQWNINRLPDIYTAFFYFKKVDLVYDYFKIVEKVYKDWDFFYHTRASWGQIFPDFPKNVSGDLAFSVAMRLMDTTHLFTDSVIDIPAFVHMKSKVQNILSDQWMDEKWTEHLLPIVREDGSIMISNYMQNYPFHYHDKSFLTDDVIANLEVAAHA